MQVTAKAKFIRMSPKKVRLLADLIRGLDVEKALTQLEFSNKDAALVVKKLLKSAISNAEENHQLKKNNLFVEEIRVDGGPTLHRFTPRAFGRAAPIRKRSSHISLILGERVATVAKGKKNDDKPAKDDIIKVADFDEFKAMEKEPTKDKDGKQDKAGKGKPQQKGFANKLFNRKSGER